MPKYRFTATIMLLLIITSLAMNTLAIPAIHSHNTYANKQYPLLQSLKGRKFLLIKLYQASDEAAINTVSIFCENTLVNLAIRVMNLSSAEDFWRMNGKGIDYKQRFMRKYGIWYRYVRHRKSLIIYTSLGYMYYVYDDGKVKKPYILGENFSNTLLKVLELRLNNVNYSVIYGGISGRTVREVIGYGGVKTENSSVMIQGGYNYTVYEEFFEKFYITINGVRIAYPLKIGVEKTTNGTLLKYFEGFILYGWIDKIIVVNDKLLDMIVDEYRRATDVDVKSPDEIIILDIYYWITPDKKYLAPMITVAGNNADKAVVIILYEDHVEANDTMTLVGKYHPSDPGINLSKAVLRDLKKSPIEDYMTSLIILITLTATPILILTYILLRKIRRK